ncbi:hypothetical protein GM524_12885, partial [Streptococcus pneumoniae]|nr:hypothetical protein [Streptococcus pneumoniae]
LNDNNQFDEGDTKLKEVVIADGKQGPKGDKGDNGKDGFTPEVTVKLRPETHKLQLI